MLNRICNKKKLNVLETMFLYKNILENTTTQNTQWKKRTITTERKYTLFRWFSPFPRPNKIFTILRNGRACLFRFFTSLYCISGKIVGFFGGSLCIARIQFPAKSYSLLNTHIRRNELFYTSSTCKMIASPNLITKLKH